MTLRILIFVLFACSLNVAYSQINLEVHVIDSLTNLPIPFVSISFIDKNGGTYTNESGVFNRSYERKIQLTSVGYYTKTLVLDSSIDTLYMLPKMYNLPELIVSPAKNKQTVMLGYYNQKHNHSLSQSSGHEIAVFIANPQNKVLHIKEVVLRIDKSKRVLQDFGFISIFKLNIFKSSPEKKIGSLINTKDLLYTSDILEKKTIINLSDLNIVMPEDGIFIGIEWVGKLSKSDSELFIVSKGSVEPFIKGNTDINNSIVYIRTNWDDNKWILFDREHRFSKLTNKPNGFTPCISIIVY